MTMKDDKNRGMDNAGSIPFIRTKKFKAIMLTSMALVLIVLAGMMSDILTPVLVGFVVAYIFEPLLAYMERLRIRRIFGVALIYMLLFVAIILAGSWLGPRLANQSARLYRNISASTFRLGLGLGETEESTTETADAGEAGASLPGGEGESETETATAPPAMQKSANGEDDDGWSSQEFDLTLEDAKEYLRRNADNIANRIASIFTAVMQKAGQGVTNMIGFIFDFLLVLVFAFFSMLHFKEIKQTIKRYIPAAQKDVTLRVIRKIDAAVSNFFRGRLLVCLLSGVVSSIGFLLSGLDYWLILGLAAGILGFIPIIGVVVSLIPAAAFAMLTPHPWGSIIGVALTFGVVQMVVEPLVGTLILSHEVKIHPVAIIIALLVGGHLFGTFGMIISIPIAATAKILLEEFVIPPLKDLADA